ncbi:hypothetical protein Tco_0180805, partial [Tanacetum coccineum]
YLNNKNVVRVTSRGFAMALHCQTKADRSKTIQVVLTKVLKSVGCAKVTREVSRDVEESIRCCVEFTISHSMEARWSNGLNSDGSSSAWKRA